MSEHNERRENKHLEKHTGGECSKCSKAHTQNVYNNRKSQKQNGEGEDESQAMV